MKDVSILGAGNYGMSLAKLLSEKGHKVTLWTRNQHIYTTFKATHRNPKYLSTVHMNHNVLIETDISRVLDTEYLINTVPLEGIREVLALLTPNIQAGTKIINGSKGIERHSLLTLSEIFKQVFALPVEDRTAYLSGPSFAEEISAGIPTAVSLAAYNQELAEDCAQLLTTEYFLVCVSSDPIGTQLCGALKNVIAIALGLADGLGLGKNTQAALIVAGIHEISRLGIAKGAQAQTFYGLAGLGDVILTCTGDLSRNRRVGIELARGKRLDGVIQDLHAVAEGVHTSHAAYHLARSLNIRVPLIEVVYRVLYEAAIPSQEFQEFFKNYSQNML